MLQDFDHDQFLSYLRKELEASERNEVNDLELLIDFYNDFPPKQFDDSDSVFFTEEVERLSKMQLPYIKGLLLDMELTWLVIENGKFKLGESERATLSALEEKLTVDEKALINKYFRDLGVQERAALINLYEHKVSKFGNNEEKYKVLESICNSYKYSSQSDESYIKILEEAANLACLMMLEGRYKHYETLAKIYRRKYEHESSAYNFSRAILAAKDEAHDILLNLTRAMRIQYELAGNEDKASNAFIEESKLTRLKNGKKETGILHLLSDYCQNPHKVALWAFGLIVFSTLVYSFFGLIPSGQNEQSFFAGRSSVAKVLWDSFYFSVVTFTTLGYGDFAPSNGISRLMANIESLGGLLLTSLFLVTLVRKYGR